MNILEVQNLSKSYDGKTFALQGCNFSLRSGSICAIVGESGSGKSTLIRLIAGLERPEEGRIQIKEKVVSSNTHITPPQQRNVGLVFQDFALFPHMTVEQNIAYGIGKHREQQVKDLLKMIQMESYAKRYPSELSGGQEQRVAIARTLALKPELLLLDEPFSNLDTGLKSSLRQEIRQIVNQVNTSLLFITHDIFDAIDIADEIIFLHQGKIIQHRPIEAVFRDVDSEYIQKMSEELKDNAYRIMEMMSPPSHQNN
ncbi:MAG: ABC transporter ATP-binding protein [Bacteroidota bacterium]